MQFKQAFEAMKGGAKIRCPEWKGYWIWSHNTIEIHCGDGEVLDIRDTQNVEYTFSFIIRDDWQIVEDIKETFSFDVAIRYLKDGKKVTRKNWNDAGIYLYMVNGSTVHGYDLRNEARDALLSDECTENDEITFLPHIDMRTANGSICVGWIASQSDMLSEDWMLV